MTKNAQVVFDHFPDLTPTQQSQFEQLGDLYKEWNAKINVISRKDIEALYTRHVLHSLAIAKYLQFPENSRVLDIGTGGGFPGIPLAILFPDCSFYLADSIGKKIMVVKEIAAALDLQNVQVEHIRVEKIKKKFDYVVSRAVARTQVLYNWTHRMIQPNDHPTLASGYLLLKGGDLDEELNEFGRSHSLTNLSEYFNDAFFETKKLVYIPV